MANTYTVKRYEGDDKYSWAVFQNLTPAQKKESILFWPVRAAMSGLSRDQANYEKKRLQESHP